MAELKKKLTKFTVGSKKIKKEYNESVLLYDLVFFKEEVQATQQDRAPHATDSAKVPEGSIQEITGA